MSYIPYYIEYHKMQEYFLQMETRINDLLILLEQTEQAFCRFLPDHRGNSPISGQSGEALAACIREVHFPIISSLQVLLRLFYGKMLLYIDACYTELDAHTGAVLSEETLEGCADSLRRELDKVSYFQEELTNILASLSDIPGSDTLPHPRFSFFEEVSHGLIRNLDDLRERIGELQEAHLHDLDEAEALLSSIDRMITFREESLLERGNIPVMQTVIPFPYQPGSASQSGLETDLQEDIDRAISELCHLENQMDEAAVRQLERENLAEARIKDGEAKQQHAIRYMLTGVTAIITTAGSATPIVVVGWTSGILSSLYGVSEFDEGVAQVRLGRSGDSDTIARNIGRDEVFGGSQTIYDSVGKASVFVAEIMPLVSWSYSRIQNNKVRILNESVGEGGSRTLVKTNLGNDIDITPSSNHTTTTVRPDIEGLPNSSVDYVDDTGNIIQRRWYDSNGQVFRDVDMTNHGNPTTHPEFPHEHIWEWINGNLFRH